MFLGSFRLPCNQYVLYGYRWAWGEGVGDAYPPRPKSPLPDHSHPYPPFSTYFSNQNLRIYIHFFQIGVKNAKKSQNHDFRTFQEIWHKTKNLCFFPQNLPKNPDFCVKTVPFCSYFSIQNLRIYFLPNWCHKCQKGPKRTIFELFEKFWPKPQNLCVFPQNLLRNPPLFIKKRSKCPTYLPFCRSSQFFPVKHIYGKFSDVIWFTFVRQITSTCI